MIANIFFTLLFGLLPIVLFFPLFFWFRNLWLALRQAEYASKLKWTILELKIPREIEQSAKAMDQIFQAWQTIDDNPGDFNAKYLKGQKTVPSSFEIVSMGGQLHFFVRVASSHKHVIESSFFSFYPDVELLEVEDYMNSFPATLMELRAQDRDAFVMDFKQNRDGFYPIKTYVEFESPDEEERYDPISIVVEVFGKLKKGEFAAVQIHTLPIDIKERRKKYEKDLEKLKVPEAKKEKDKEGKEKENQARFRTKEEDATLAAVERNLAKPAFNCVMRFAFVGEKDVEGGMGASATRKGIGAAFSQYTVADRNGISFNSAGGPFGSIWYWPHVSPKLRTKLRSQRAWQNFRFRDVEPIDKLSGAFNKHPLNSNSDLQKLELSSEELATLFHPPTRIVLTAPHTERVESKKRSAPSGLPIFADENVIEKFTGE